MVTAKDSEADKVTGLELGADDYVTKPFSVRELVSRVRAHLRRASMRGELPPADDVVRGGPVEMDVGRHEVRVRGEAVAFPPKEFELLEAFLRRKDRLLTRLFLIEEVWGADYVGDTKTLDVHVKRIRQKIEDDPHEPQPSRHRAGPRLQVPRLSPGRGRSPGALGPRAECRAWVERRLHGRRLRAVPWRATVHAQPFPEPVTATSLAVHQPRALLARVRLARARARRGSCSPAARAGEVRRDLQPEPRRVLPDPRVRPRGAGGGRRRRDDARRHEPTRSSSPRSASGSIDTAGASRLARARRAAAGAREGAHPARALGAAVRRRPGVPRAALPGAHLPGADAALGGSRRIRSPTSRTCR